MGMFSIQLHTPVEECKNTEPENKLNCSLLTAGLDVRMQPLTKDTIPHVALQDLCRYLKVIQQSQKDVAVRCMSTQK